MAGLVPAIHVLGGAVMKGVIAGLDPAIYHFEMMDTRVKPAYDAGVS
ncbi:MAG: hypothetical protein J0H71_08205 [Rhizobiales bacterium]|nr:hypothetical protein [Hyphomicrobiales bacterium]